MKKILLPLLFSLTTLAGVAQVADFHTAVGKPVPAFSFEIEKGKKVKISDYKGKLVWINFFATWCPPCNAELPEAQKVWNKYKNDPRFAFFVFGREEDWGKLIPFREKKGFTFPILPDTGRLIFRQFADNTIPRNVLVDTDGKIIYQSVGYTPEEFEKLVMLIDKKLKK